jgi:hypothetical protein
MTDQATAGVVSAPRRRVPWGAILLGIAILGVGIIIGAGGMVIITRSMIQHAARHPEQIPEKAAQRLARRLDLSEQQKQQVQAIITDRLRKVNHVRQKMQPLIAAEVQKFHDDVAEVLTEEQAQEWDEIFERYRESIHSLRGDIIPHAPPSVDEDE